MKMKLTLFTLIIMLFTGQGLLSQNKPVKFERKIEKNNKFGLPLIKEEDTYKNKPGTGNNTIKAVTFWTDDFETDKGWTYSGSWQRGVPSVEPTNDHTTGSGNILANPLDADYPNNMSREDVTSPVIDCSSLYNVQLSYWSFSGCESSSWDHMGVEVFDGTTWQSIWTNGSSFQETAWTQYTFDVSAYADGNASFQIRFYMGTTDGSVTYSGWAIDDIEISGDVPGENTITAGSTTEPLTIPSITDTQAEAFINFDFTVTDDGTNPGFDTNNTQFNQIVINQGAGNDIAVWTEAIAGAQLSDGTTTVSGTINATNITFSGLNDAVSGDFGFIPDNGNKTYSLKIWLLSSLGGTLPSSIDGLNLEFEVTSSSFSLETTSSGFVIGETETSGALNNEVTVTATQLTFTGQPSTVATSGVALTQQPVVEATDENGNRDLQINTTVTLSNTGTLLTANNSTTFTNGIADFAGSGFMFTTGGEYVMLNASDGTLNTVTPSLEIAVDVTGCEIYAEDFNAIPVMSDLDGTGGWSYTEITNSGNDWGIAARAGNGNCLTIYNNTTAFQYSTSDNAEEIAHCSNLIDATGYRNVTITFDWQSDAEAGRDWGNIMWSTDGTNWSIANSFEFEGQGTWTTGTFDLSVVDGQQFYIGFKWKNDRRFGTNPPFAVDNISIKGIPDFNYNFSYRNDIFKQITGTVVTVDANDGANISLPAGFDFQYDGTSVTSIRANINGWLEMGTSHTANAETNGLISTSEVPFLAPLWDDLVADAQTRIIYRVDGDAPTRVFTVEWLDVLWGGTRQNFQVKLYETSYVIEFWYGQMHTPSSASASIGINNTGLCMNKIISVIPGTTPIASYNAENSNINSVQYLTEGLVYIFNPLLMQEYRSWQDATIVVGQVDFATTSNTVDQSTSSGANSSSVSSKGVLAVGSAYANRVLIWNTLPETNGVPADVVVGQTNFTSSTAGTSATELDSPYNVAFSPDGEKLLVADAGNNRVLIWNTVPTTNGVSADVVIGQPDFTSNTAGTAADKLNFPTGILVLPDGRLVITEAGNNRVLIFNSIPTTNGASADVVIGQPDFTSNTAGSGANQFDTPWDCAYSPEGKLLVSDDGSPTLGGNHRILIFNDVPTTNGASADIVIGNTTFAQKTAGTTKDEFDQPSITCSVEGKLAIADFGNSRLMLYNRVPAYNGAPADYVLGQPYFETKPEFNNGFDVTGTPNARNMYFPYSICFDLNGRLYANGTQGTGTGMHRVMIFGQTPTQTADLEVLITPDQTTVCVYNDVKYTVNVINHGPDNAYNITVNSQLPLGFTPIDYSAQDGSTYNQKSGYWKIPFIAVNDTAQLIFTGTVQPDLAGNSSVVAYANTLASSQKDSNYANNADNATVAVRNFYAPTITEIDDQYIPRNSHTIPVISFTVDDGDGLSDITSYTATSSNTTLIPVDYANNIIFGGTAPNKTLDIYPVTNQYGYSDMSVIVTDSHGCYNEEPFLVTVGNFWEGDDITAAGSNTDWTIAENWSVAVPTSTIEAIIPTTPKGGFFPVIDVAGTVCEDLLIEPRASVTITDTYGLHVYGDFYIQSDASGTGSFTDLNSSGFNQVVIDGNIFIDRYITPDAWHYLSTPLTGVTNKVLTENVCGTNYNGNVLDYNEAFSTDYDNDGDIDWFDGWEWPWYYVQDNNPLISGNGYAYYTFAGQCSDTVQFTGTGVTLNTGNFSYTVTNQDDTYAPTGFGPHRGWNLIGNPYPSGLNADNFISANSSVIDGTVYFWDETGQTGFDLEGADYASYNPTLGGAVGTGSGTVVPDKYISIGQAFFVHRSSTDVAGTPVNFANSMRETENSYFFKSENNRKQEVPKIKLSMRNPAGHYNEIVVGMIQDATLERDTKYDGYKIEGNKYFAFYSKIGQENFVFQGIPYVSKNKQISVPLGFNAEITGTYVINANLIEYFPDTVGLYLEDTYTGEFFDLKVQKTDTIYVSEPGRFDDRFILHFNLNHAPYVNNPLEDKYVYADEGFSFTIPYDAFADDDKGTVLTYSASFPEEAEFPSWMRFDSETLTFYGAPAQEHTGTYYVTVTATDNAGAQAKSDFLLNVLENASSISDITNKFMLYPNPSNGKFFIKSNSGEQYVYKVTNIAGQELINKYANSNTEEVDLSSYVSGVYFIKIISGNNVYGYKIVIQK